MGLAKITQGTDVTLNLYVRDSDDQPYSLSGATEINVKLPAAAGGAVEKKLSLAEVTVVSAELGHISVAYSDTDTDLLLAGTEQDFEVVIDVGSTRKIAKFEAQLTVTEKQF